MTYTQKTIQKLLNEHGDVSLSEMVKILGDVEKKKESDKQRIISEIKSKFVGKFFKHRTESEFTNGYSIDVMKIDSFDDIGYNTEFEPYYNFSVKKVCISTFIIDKYDGDEVYIKSYNTEQLSELVEITEDEFNEYISKNNTLFEQLERLTNIDNKPYA